MRVAIATVLCALSLASSGSAQLRGVAAENIDRTANPCSDFDAYANGAWRASHPMPAIQTTWAVRTITQDETRARLRSIAEQDAAKASTQPKGSPAELTGDFYASCMDEPKVNALGLQPLEPLLKTLAAIHDPASLDAAIVHLQEVGIAAPLDIGAAQDVHSPTHMIAELNIAGLGLPDRDYYLRDEPRFASARENYIVYGNKMLTLAGASASDATAAMVAVLKIETALAQARLSRVELRDPKVQDNPMTFAELK